MNRERAEHNFCLFTSLNLLSAGFIKQVKESDTYRSHMNIS
jgi:hypothetical protein